MKNRLKIFYQYSTVSHLRPKGGDFINEMGNILALSQFADVSYGKNIKADIYFIRGNSDLFHQFNGKKRIWVASPYDYNCFKNANIIATLSKSWENALKNGTKIPGLNPFGIKFKNAASIYQTIMPNIKPSKHLKKSRDIRKNIFKGDIVIGCFGAIRNTNYPKMIFNNLKVLKKEFKNIKFIFGITVKNQKLKIPRDNSIVLCNFGYKEMPYAISACDIIMTSQHGVEWDYCGNLKVLEGMGCGIPVICQKSLARQEMLGDRYSLFLPKKYFDTPNTPHALIKTIHHALDHNKAIGDYVYEKSKFYNVDNNSKRLKELISRI